MAKKLSAETAAIITAIEKASMVAEGTAANVAVLLSAHTKDDDTRFAALTRLVESIALDVKSLLDSRAYARGAWWGMATLAGTVSAAVAIFIAWVKG